MASHFKEQPAWDEDEPEGQEAAFRPQVVEKPEDDLAPSPQDESAAMVAAYFGTATPEQRKILDRAQARKEAHNDSNLEVTSWSAPVEPEPEHEEVMVMAHAHRDSSKVSKQKRKSGLVCPHCGSEDVILAGSTRSPLSAGKMVAGGLVAGPGGAVVGALMGKKGKNEFICRSCGRKYRK